MSKALYATNVYHYDHVLLAMKDLYDEVGLVKQLEFTQPMLDKLKRLRVPASILDVLARRVREPSSLPNVSSTFGSMQLANPLLTRMGIALKPAHIRAINSNYARLVERRSKGYDSLHFVEGLGYRAISKRNFELIICERRNFHHEVFEEQLELLCDFPINGRRDPIADVLEYEYANSDYIFVYSEAVKKSFLSRGFQSSKIKVVPIGIGPQLERLALRRDPYQLIYVGRGDPFKGLDIAVATVRALGKPFRLKVAGPMPPSVGIWLRSQPEVDYLGILNRIELRELYSSSAAMLLPSTESFGLAAAEAVYHGLPLICSDKTGIAEYLPDSTRKVISGRDPNVWAATVEEALSTVGRSERVPCVALEDAYENLTWTAAARKVRDTYASVLDDGLDRDVQFTS